jgi:ribosomal protein S18 acetylase RimI-like enzyme
MKTEQIIVQEAVVDDAPEILDMQRKLAEHCGYHMEWFGITESIIRGVVESSTASSYYLAKRRDECVGMILCHVVPLGWSGSSGIYVEDLFVEPRFRRGLSIGRLLMGQACRRALELANGDDAAAFVRLDTSKDYHNTGTRAFYERLGMENHDANFRTYGRTLLGLAEFAN